ncbi:MAG: MBL fold metallo-hydrolase [Gammaproteobacteria bacterium]|nr:MBL fold metallo-hydrolase [Gammaproteobacteria bacterium]
MNRFNSDLRIKGLLVSLFVGITLAGSLVAGANAGDILKTEKLADNVYALVGPLTNRTPENLGNNASFGVIVTDDGVVLIDSGGTYKGAEMIHSALRGITDKPVKVVINSGGQDHRWLGNGYFKARGARIIANDKAVADQKARARDQLSGLAILVGAAGLEGTEPVYADEEFTESRKLVFGNTPIEIYHAGHAHTPGDSFIWLPQQRILFSGDIVYLDRMLGIGPQSAHLSWINAFETMAAYQPRTVVGGHGTPAALSKARSDTYDYLVFIRKAVSEFMEQGNGIEDIGTLDQSRFGYLENYDTLKGRNAQRVFEELEWE